MTNDEWGSSLIKIPEGTGCLGNGPGHTVDGHVSRSKEKGMNKKLYVGNLSYQTTEGALSELSGQFGEVVSANLIIDRYSGRTKGFAFIEMAEQSAAREAIDQLNGKQVDWRTIKVEEARPRRLRRQDSWSGHSRY
jgi:RNA recognition motif-containing protein